jgi:membrane protease YdiL (CAAX protease family)
LIAKVIWPFWNLKERRLRALWRIGIQGGLFISISLLLEIIWQLAVASLQVNSGSGFSTLVNFFLSTQTITAIAVFFTLLSMIASYWIASRILDRRPLADFGFHFNNKWWRNFGFGLLLGAFLMAFIFLVELGTGLVVVSGFMTAGESGSFIENILLAFFLFICVGIYEEMLARGYQLRNLAEGLHFSKMKSWVAIVIGYLLSSIIFGLLHADNPFASVISTANLFIAGLFLGLGYVLTGELAIPIGLHIAWNFFEGNVFGFAVSGTNAGATFIAIQQRGSDLWTGGSFGPEGGLVGILALVVGSGIILWWVRRTTGILKLENRLADYTSRAHTTS